MTPETELTFGQKAVGITFNPSGDATVLKLKQLYAEVIDTLTDGNLDNGATGLKGRFLGRAINDAVAAQMWAVKAVTFIDSAPVAPSPEVTSEVPAAAPTE